MGNLNRAILLNFRTKVIAPVVFIMSLLLAGSMWLVNQRVTGQLQADAAQQLATADAVLGNLQQSRADALLSSFRKVQSEPKFKSIATLFDTGQEHLSDAAQKTIRAFLDGLISEKFADVVTVIASDDRRITATADTWLKRDLFESSCESLVAQAYKNGATIGEVFNENKLLDVVAVPLLVGNEPVGVIVFGVRNTLAEQVREIGGSELLLLSEGRALTTTARERELESQLNEPSVKASLAAPGKIGSTILNDEHFLCLSGTLKNGGDSAHVDYLLLNSYEKPLQVLMKTQQTIFIVSVASIFFGIAVVWIYVRRVTAPLEALREHTEAVGRGDFTRRLELNARDEFGELAQAFNHMTENLKNSRAQLEATVESLKTTQQQLIQSEKLSGIGEFVAGVAHELNNPLTTVMGFSELLQESGADPQQKRYLEMINKSAVRCQKIVQNLLSFARRHKPEQKLVDVNKLLEGSVDILGYQLRTSNIEVAQELSANLPRVLADPHQLQQVFINILNNGRQAMEAHQSKGRIRISSSERDGRIAIVFQDNGPGIRKEHLQKLFDPFFTTKEVGKGTGLGLSICYGIIKEHGGSIKVESEYGSGAAFIIDLPVAADNDRASHNTALVQKPKLQTNIGQGRSALVIDDEEQILQMTGEILTRAGFVVETAADGETGLKKALANRHQLIISDWKMPGIGGQQFFERLAAASPDKAGCVVFITGDVVNDSLRSFLEKHGRPCLPKPFNIADLESVVKETATAA